MAGIISSVGKVASVNLSEKKGMRKTPVPEGHLKEGFGMEGDAHASGEWGRQVSLLQLESIGKMKAKGLDVGAGDFAENITTEGIDLTGLKLGDKLRIGPAEVEITQIGKKCHSRCEIYRLAGDCIMPREGIFAKVLRGGRVKKGDPVTPL